MGDRRGYADREERVDDGMILDMWDLAEELAEDLDRPDEVGEITRIQPAPTRS